MLPCVGHLSAEDPVHGLVYSPHAEPLSQPPAVVLCLHALRGGYAGPMEACRGYESPGRDEMSLNFNGDYQCHRFGFLLIISSQGGRYLPSVWWLMSFFFISFRLSKIRFLASLPSLSQSFARDLQVKRTES